MPRGKQLSVGLFTYELGGDPNSLPLWIGVGEITRRHGANLFCFPANPVRSPIAFEAQANVLYELVGPENLDGLIVWGGILGVHLGVEEFGRFCERFQPLPIVNVGMLLPGIPSVLVDSYGGVRALVSHLIEVHGCREIAYIQGPPGSPESVDRYRGYCDALTAHGLSVDPGRVAPGDFKKPAGVRAVDLLLERKVRFDSLVAANDMMALGAMERLQEHGFRIPTDVLVCGFDDIEESAYSAPALTTARQSFRTIGQRATELLFASLSGKEIPQEEIVPADLVLRRSCGCFSPTVERAAAGPLPEPSDEAEGRAAVLQQVAEAFGETWPGAVETAGELLEACLAEVRGRGQGTFLQTLDQLLQAALSNGQVFVFEDALSALRHGVLRFLPAEERARAEDLWHQARVRIAEAERQFQGYRRVQVEQRARLLREVSQQLATTFRLHELLEVLARELPHLGIRRGYVALYEHPDRPAEQARLVLAFGPEGRVPLEEGGRLFPSREIVPPDLMPQEGGLAFVVEPLYFREQQLGFAVFEAHAQDGTTADALRAQISSSLQGARLVQQVERHALQLQAASEVSRLATSILDPERLIRQVVDLIRERFDLYYVGLFLLDRTGEWTGEPQKWLVLRAGTGEAGRQMVEQGHRLEVGGASMVGWCAQNRRPRVAHDVAQDPVHRPHPLLPETRSEIAFPLRVGDAVIGVLDAQSAQRGTFDEDLVTVFQTMADQLAVAIENAFTVYQMQLVNKDLQQTLATQEQLLETIRQLSTPVVPLLEGVILLPLVGHIDSRRAAQIMEELLAGVQRHRAQVAILDITGVPVVDTAVANSLLRAAQASYLLGAEVILVGIRPEVAQTIVGLGVELRGLVTMSDLQSGIEYALRRMGARGAQ